VLESAKAFAATAARAVPIDFWLGRGEGRCVAARHIRRLSCARADGRTAAW